METEPKDKGHEFYDQVIDCYKKIGIEHLITISYYQLPYSLVDKYNGWIGRDVIHCYQVDCAIVYEHYKDHVQYWLTLYEIDMGRLHHGEMAGNLPHQGLPQAGSWDPCILGNCFSRPA
jgi:Beta-glucosidase/6-phospho-beta-glucosidase/beta-galactosidase